MKPILAITMGDPAGIGAEISVKALANPEIYRECTPFIIGDRAALEDALSQIGSTQMLREIAKVSELTGKPGVIEYLNMGFLTPGGWEYKKVSPVCGNAAFQYVQKGIQFALAGEVHCVVTGPINKEAINLAGYHYSGHTEIFADLTSAKSCAMLLVSNHLKVIHVTTHVSMRRACDLVTKRRVGEVISLAQEALELMGIGGSCIAVAGLNPHCSENGLFGDEEEKEILPAIRQAQKQGINVEGPIPPDTVFVKALAGKYSMVVAMYHDQGHIPLKLNGFKMDPVTGLYDSVSGINCTIGLPILRTSVDHGTAFDKAGDGCANAESMADAIRMGSAMARKKFG